MINKIKSAIERKEWHIGKYFLLIFLPLTFLLFGLVASLYYIDVKNQRRLHEIDAINIVNIQKEIIAADFRTVFSDLMVLVAHHDLQVLIERGDIESRNALSQEFLVYCDKKGLYDQIRFLDEEGMEIVRVNYNGGEPYIVPADKLQLKTHRYYFKESFIRERDEVYISPFDLNMEKGGIERPLKPMIRFGTPVFNGKSKKRGVLILNYLGNKLLNNFEKFIANVSGQVYLLNSDGYWLKGPEAGKEWGFMYKEGKSWTFGSSYPDVWKKISEKESGQLYTAEGMFTFATVKLPTEMQLSKLEPEGPLEPNWKIVSHIPTVTLDEASQKLLFNLLLLSLVILVPLSTGSWFLARMYVVRKKTEAELRQKGRLAEMGEMFTHLAHDIRSPLGTIGMAHECLTDSTDIGDEDKELLKFVGRGIDTLNAMVNDLLDYSRGDSLNIEPFDCLEVIDEILGDLKRNKVVPGVEVTKNFPEKCSTLNADKLKIRQVLTNVINNAIQSMSEGGILALSILEENKALTITVTDTGAGIPRENLEKIFTPFFTTKKKGTGLGMAIIKRFVELHDGDITIESTVGKGTTVVIILPL